MVQAWTPATLALRGCSERTPVLGQPGLSSKSLLQNKHTGVENIIQSWSAYLTLCSRPQHHRGDSGVEGMLSRSAGEKS